MIKNIIFDIGNVLVAFKPLDFLNSKYDDKETVDTLYNLIFKSREWILLDLGAISEEEAVEVFCKTRPELEEEIKYVMENWHMMHIPMKKSVELLNHLRNQGYHIYLLSNYHKKAFKIISEKFDFINEVDGKIISSHVKLLKPDKEIYEALLKKYNLKSEECLFIDDTAVNIEGAKKMGMGGVCFNGTESIDKVYELCS